MVVFILSSRRDESGTEEGEVTDSRGNAGGAVGGAVYGLGFIGALVYFIQTATSFWDGAYGVFQAMVWPAYFVYEVFHFLKM